MVTTPVFHFVPEHPGQFIRDHVVALIDSGILISDDNGIVPHRVAHAGTIASEHADPYRVGANLKTGRCQNGAVLARKKMTVDTRRIDVRNNPLPFRKDVKGACF